MAAPTGTKTFKARDLDAPEGATPLIEDIELIEDQPQAPSMALAIDRTEVDLQISTARRYPRSIKLFKEQALEMATLDEETAGSMFYALKRDGKVIEGPSVRLAEVVVSAWGNIRAGARIVEIGDRTIRAQGVAFDLEKNTSVTVEVTRRIVGKNGHRYSDDMISVTANAACAVAYRQAVFKVVPFTYIKPAYEAAKQTALGKALSMEQRRARALDWFAKLNVPAGRVLRLLGRPGVDEITVDDLVTLQGIRTALQDGETTVDQAFRETDGEPERPPQQPAGNGNGGNKPLDQKRLDQVAAELSKTSNPVEGISMVAPPPPPPPPARKRKEEAQAPAPKPAPAPEPEPEPDPPQEAVPEPVAEDEDPFLTAEESARIAAQEAVAVLREKVNQVRAGFQRPPTDAQWQMLLSQMFQAQRLDQLGETELKDLLSLLEGLKAGDPGAQARYRSLQPKKTA